jgi:DNA repair protein RadA/Sms
LRLKEAAKLGFDRGWVPKGTEGPSGIALTRFERLRELVDQILGR